MSYDVLAMIAVVLTLGMFLAREMLLGFPATIMWAILGAYAYQESAAAWDIDYILFFASAVGMTIFCTLSIFVLWRAGKQELEGADESEIEGEEDMIADEGEEQPSIESKRVKGVRERAKQRRER